MAYGRTAGRVRREIIRLCQAGLDSQTLRREALRRLAQAVPIDAFFCASADPTTLLFTGSVLEGIPASSTPDFLRNEFQQNDVNKFAELAHSGGRVSTLAQATGGNIEASARYTELLAPMRLGDELRAAIMAGSTCWGFMCLHREGSSPPFSAAECGYLAGLLPHLAEGLRHALLLERVRSEPDTDVPGLLILSSEWSLVSCTAAAERWLAEVAELDWPGSLELPLPIYALAASLRDTEHSGTTPRQLPLTRLQTASGRWLTLHASRLPSTAGEAQTAIIIEPASPRHLAPVIVQTYGLSTRESEIVQLVLRGLSTNEIAGRLCISPLTVQDHVKAIFDKVGVRSRGELAARIFGEHYRPALASSLPAAANS